MVEAERSGLSDSTYLRLIGVGLAFSALGCEWTWGLANPFLLNATSRTLVLPYFLLLATREGVFNFTVRKGTQFRQAGLAVLWFGLVVLAGQLLAARTAVVIRWDFYVTMALTPVLGFVGYSFALDGRDVQGAYRRFALVLSIAGGYAAIVPAVEAGDAFPSWTVGFPVALFVLFGYCWYLVVWMSQGRRNVASLVGLVACAMYVLVRFHKPIVFSAGIATLATVAYFMLGARDGAAIRRFLLVAAIGALAFAFANYMSGGALLDYYVDSFYSKVLHTTEGGVAKDPEELMRLASGGRFDLWDFAIESIQANPLIGSGHGQMVLLGDNGEAIPVHNGYLDHLQSVGLLGTLPVLALFLVWIKAIGQFRKTHAPPIRFLPAATFVLGLMAYNAGGMSAIFHTVNAFGALIMGMTIGDARAMGLQAMQAHGRHAQVQD